MRDKIAFSVRLLALAVAFCAVGRAWADTETVDGIKWRYTIVDGEASVGSGKLIAARAVPQSTEGAITIPAILGGYSVTSIGDYAFYNCSGFTSVAIPDSVTSIGDCAFSGCSGLSSVMIPDGVISIGSAAFYGCSGLTSVMIPDSVTSIGSEAFRGCSSLTSVTIPDSVTSIGNYAFAGCSDLTSVIIPDSVTSIGDSAFAGCSGLTSVMIGNGVKSIGLYAFRNCSNLMNVAIPQSVCYMGASSVFPDAYQNIINIVIAEGVTTITSYMFMDCYSLKSITIPASVARISLGAFSNCNSLREVHIADIAKWCAIVFEDENSNPFYGGGTLYLCDEPLRDLSIPDSVTSIGDWAFARCNGVTNVVIKEGVANIGAGAFAACRNLTNIEIPDSVTSIGDYAFASCGGLASVEIPNSVTSIGESAFSGCSGLTSVTIPDSVTSIAYGAFINCSGLTSVTIGNGVKSIGNYAFYNCRGLTSVVMPDSVMRIGDYAFYGCNGLTSVTMPDSVTSIGDYAFYGCSGLTSVTIGNGVKSIGDYAFYGCRNLTGFIMPDSVTAIGDHAFHDCTNLTSVVIPNSVTNMGTYAFAGCSSVTSVTIEDGVASIGGCAFQGCSSLTSVTIPDSVVSVGNNAFEGCCESLFDVETMQGIKILDGWAVECSNNAMSVLDLTYIRGVADNALSGLSGIGSLTMPKSMLDFTVEKILPNSYLSITNVVIQEGVSEIGSSVFAKCSNLVRLTIPSSIMNISNKAFSFCENLRELSFSCDMTVGELPKARRMGYKFTGWFSEEDGGSQLLTGMNVHEGEVYYARWTEMGYFVIDSFDLAIPETITVFDEYYEMLDTLSHDLIAAAYDVDGDLIDIDLIYAVQIERLDGGDLRGNYSWLYDGYCNNIGYNRDNNCIRAGVYVVTVCSLEEGKGSGSATQTISVEKMNYNDYTTPTSWIECHKNGSYYDYSEVIELGSVSSCSAVEVYAFGDYVATGDMLLPVINIYVDGMPCPSDWYTISPYYSTSYIQFHSAGCYEIRAEIEGHYAEDDYGYCYVEGESVSKLFNVAPEDIKKLSIEVASDLVFTGEEIRNEGGTSAGYLFGDNVRLSIGEETSLLIENPVAVTNAGTYRLAVKSFGIHINRYGATEGWIQYAPDAHIKYGGITYVWYTVAPRSVVADQMELTLPLNPVYEGMAKVCSITITNDYNGVLLQEGVDYDVEYSNNVYPGTATVTITCKGNYTGTFSRTFEIVNADFGLASDGENGGASGESGSITGYEGVYDGEGHGLAVDVSAIGDVGVRYALAEEGPYADSLLLTNVCDQTVWVELTALNYNSFTGFAQVVISPKSIEGCQIEVESPVAYDGHAMQAVVSVVDEDLGTALVEGIDYELEYSDNEAVGVAGVKVVGIGNYKDEVERTYEIVKGTILVNDKSTWQWIGAEGFTFDGENKTVVFASDGAVPEEVVEVEITGVTNAVHAGTYTAYANGTITGSETDDFYNYYYTTVLENVACSWSIAPRSCDNCDASLSPGVMFHTGGGLEPEITVVDRTLGVVLEEGVDYSLEYEDNVTIGIAQVHILFNGDYSGSETLTFRIVDVVENLPKVKITPASGICGERVGVTLNYDGVEGVDKCVRYTLDGSEPTGECPVYSGRFQMELAGGVWIKAAAFVEGLRISEISASHIYPTIASVVLGEGSDGIMFSNDEERPWSMDDVVLDPYGKSTMRSCEDVANNTKSGLSATFRGKGTLSFKWKTSCEVDAWGSHFFDHAAFVADGVEVEWLDGVTDWVSVSLKFKSAGDHVVQWKYVKDDGDDDDYPGQDCVWLADVIWEPTTDPAIVVEGDDGATIEGDSENGYTVRPSDGKKDVVVTIPEGVEPENVTVEVAADVETVKANGANVKVMNKGHDIAAFLDLASVTSAGGVINLAESKVKDEVVKEALDTASGADIKLSPTDPSITTSNTRPGLKYTFVEGQTIEELAPTEQYKWGDNTPFKPTPSIKGGTSGFYTIKVEK